MRMKKVLIVAYYFPPSGGPGVQRVLKHIKYLPEFGWQPVVLTVSNGQYPAIDESLLEQVPESTIIYKSRILEPYDLYRKFTGKKKGTAIDVNTIKKEGQKVSLTEKIAEFIRATFFIPDARIGWLFTAKDAVAQILKEHKIDAVYSSSPPYTCSLIANHVKKTTNTPWVAGFRDPWTGFISSPNRWFIPKMIDRKMEFNTFNNADAVECAWQGIIKDAMGKYPRLDESKFFHVPNGFDSSDFPEVEEIENDKFTVTYTGSMYGRRNPASFFEAIEKLIAQNLVDPQKLHLRFVGRFGNEVEEMFAKASFSSQIEKVSYVPHHESIKYLMQSDALLLVVDESKESEEIVPGKVYEYVGCKRPIIAIAPPQSAIADLMRETNSGRIAHQSEIDKTCDIILEYYRNWQSGGKNYAPNTEIIRKYERREAAKTLAELLNKFTK